MTTERTYKKIIFRCDARLYARLEQMADSYGLSINAMTSYIMASQLHAYTKMVEPMMHAMPEQIRELMAKMAQVPHGPQGPQGGAV